MVKKNNENSELGLIFGLVVGDVLGVPFEFTERELMSLHPFTGEMVGYGTHMQTIGTWSDDSSMALCTLESIVEGYSINKLAIKFTQWHKHGLWTPHGKVFDIGMTTRRALDALRHNISPYSSGQRGVYDNGNGSLMRIAPVLFLVQDLPPQAKFELIAEISGITHAHIRSVLACYYYIEFLCCLGKGYNKEISYTLTNLLFADLILNEKITDEERSHFDRILSGKLKETPSNQIHGTGYVIQSLEAALWCFFNTDNYKDAVIEAINLGDDTDTTAAVTGALAGYFYGFDNIPEEYVKKLVKQSEILELCKKYFNGIK